MCGVKQMNIIDLLCELPEQLTILPQLFTKLNYLILKVQNLKDALDNNYDVLNSNNLIGETKIKLLRKYKII